MALAARTYRSWRYLELDAMGFEERLPASSMTVGL
jgi:hypothetical protein